MLTKQTSACRVRLQAGVALPLTALDSNPPIQAEAASQRLHPLASSTGQAARRTFRFHPDGTWTRPVPHIAPLQPPRVARMRRCTWAQSFRTVRCGH